MQDVTVLRAVAILLTDAIVSALVWVDFSLLAFNSLSICCMFKGIGVSKSMVSVVLVVVCVHSSQVSTGCRFFAAFLVGRAGKFCLEYAA